MAKGVVVFFSVSCILILLAGVTGCGVHTSSVDENLFGGGAAAEEDKLVITVTCQAGIGHFAAAVEERFPDVRLVQDIYQGEYVESEHETRIEHGDIGDILMMKAGLIPKQDLSGLLIDLSATSIPENYNTNALQTDTDGRIYLVSGPLSFNCNVYNRTLFEENGWSVPESYDEFVALCQRIDKTGTRGCRYVYHDANMQMFNYCARSAVDTLTTVEGQTWHSQLLAGEEVTLEPMETAFQDLQNLMDAGIVRAEDLSFSKDMRNVSLLNREQAIGAAEIAALLKFCEEGCDEFRFMPHFSYTDGEAWLLNLGYYFGANNKLRERGNEKKQEAVMEILSFIAAKEGQDLLIEDGIGMVPSTRGAVIPDDPLLENIRSQIENGRYMVRPVYNMFSSVLSTEIASFIRGETTSDEILKKCRDARKEGASEPAALGQAEADFTVWQTALLKADALRDAADADVALMGVAEIDGYAPVGGTRCRIYEGAITEEDVLRVNQLKINMPLQAVHGKVSGEKLLEMLEFGAASETELEAGATDHFHPFAVSGLTLAYEPEAEAGSRVSHVKLASGKALDLKADYTVAYLEGALAQGTVSDDETLDSSMADLFRAYIQKEETVSPDGERIRFK